PARHDNKFDVQKGLESGLRLALQWLRIQTTTGSPKLLPALRNYLLLTLLRRQTANEHHQGRGIIWSELLSECRHFTFNAVQNGRLHSFVGLFHLVEIWPLVSGCINAVAVRTITAEHLRSGRAFRIFGRPALPSQFAGGYGNIRLTDARRS